MRRAVPELAAWLSRLRGSFKGRSGSAPASVQAGQGLDLDGGLRLALVVALGVAVLSSLPFRSQTETQLLSVPLPAAGSAAEDVPMTVAMVRPAMRDQAAHVTAPPAGRVERADPQALCDLLAGEGRAMPWAESLLFPGEWECISPSVEASPEPAGRPLFAMARGSDAAKIDIIRLKLSLDDADTTGARRRLVEIADALMQAQGRRLPEAIRTSLRTLTPARNSDDSLDIAFIAEKMFPGRYNLVITFK